MTSGKLRGLRATVLIGTALAAINSAEIAFAQAEDAQSNGLEGPASQSEIIVSATKSGDALRDAPISVSDISADDLEVAQIRTTEDVVARAPNVVFNTVQSRSQVFIRGVGSSFSLAGAESAVAAYQDGVYLQRQGGSTLALFDVASVQVMRGPQSVLYGRNATGGAISVITNDPVMDMTEGSAEITYGRFNEYRGQAVMNVPFGENLAVRFAGMASGNDAMFDNVGPGRDMGENRSYYLRGKIAWEPTSEFKAIIGAEYIDILGSPQAQHVIGDTTCLGCQFGATGPQGFYDVATNNRTGPFLGDGLKGHEARIKTFALSLRMEYENDLLAITSVTSNRDQDVLSRSDNDLTSAPLFFARVDEQGPTFTQDFYVRTKFEGPFNFLAGFFYERERNTQFAKFSGDFFGGIQPGQIAEAQVDAMSFYFDGWYNFTPELRLTAGVRYSADDKTIIVENDAEGTLAAGGLTGYRQSRSYEYATPHVVLSYDTGDAYYYASYAEGVRDGFFTTPSFVPLASLDSERLRNWEIGAKNSFMDGRLQTSIAIFYGKFDDIIVQYNDPAGGGIRAQNAASSELYGGELELTYKVSPALSVNAGVAYLHNEFTNFQDAAVFAPGPGGLLVPATEDLSGRTVPRAPEFTGFAGFDYTADIGSWSMRLGANANYTGSYDYTAGAGGPLRRDRQDSYILVNASATLYAPGDRFYIKAYARNLTGEKYITNAATDDFGSHYIPAAPATYGAGVGFKF